MPSARPAALSASQVQREFRGLLEGGLRLRPAGSTRRRPLRLLSLGYQPRYRLRLFDATYYLARVRQNEDVRFFVAYVIPRKDLREAYPRIFYKDMSLVWRSASHYVQSREENWIGKGDVRIYREDGQKLLASVESTTDLPLEIQTALETLSRDARRIRYDTAALGLVLRRAPDDRIEPYRDFTAPRRRAQADRRNLVNGGRRVARFTRRNDPSSLRFTPGFEPDFRGGILEVSRSTSRLYGGALRRFRILSRNRRIQYLFMAGPRHVWIIPPQATTTEIMSYGVRTVDVVADEDLFIPGYEYHLAEGSQGRDGVASQIPDGYAGPPSEVDGSRADASAWLEKLPVIREFRRKVLASR